MICSGFSTLIACLDKYSSTNGLMDGTFVDPVIKYILQISLKERENVHENFLGLNVIYHRMKTVSNKRVNK